MYGLLKDVIFEANEYYNSKIFKFIFLVTKYITYEAIFITLDGISCGHTFLGEVPLRSFWWHHGRSFSKKRTKY